MEKLTTQLSSLLTSKTCDNLDRDLPLPVNFHALKNRAKVLFSEQARPANLEEVQPTNQTKIKSFF